MFLALFVAGVVVAGRLMARGHAAKQGASTETVAGKTYDVWVSQGFASPPFTPFHDCYRFTKNTITTDACGGSGPLTEIHFGLYTIWSASLSCGGVNLNFNGTSIDSPEIPVMGGSLVGVAEATNFGFEGVENSSCSLTAPQGQNPYSKGQ